MGPTISLPREARTRSVGKVLIFGDDTRSFLATVRSLGRKDIVVDAAPIDFQSPALSSRYIRRVHFLPYYLQDGNLWLSALTTLLEAERYDLVIPCDERTLLPLHRHRDVLAPLSRLAIPDERAIAVFFDKHETRELARSAGVPVAAGRLIAEADTAGAIIAETALPLVIKPRQSYELGNLYSRGKVAVIAEEGALSALLVSVRGGTHLAEAFFPGEGVGVSLLASQGAVLQAFQHRRVHERDGSGYYRVSAPLSPALSDAAGRMVAALGYTGLAMFEFKRNPVTEEWILLEVNARPWGSMPLPVGLGIDFPYFWYRLLVEDIKVPVRPYREGVHARNLVPDLMQLLSQAKALRGRPLMLARLLLGHIGEHGRLLTGREFHDVLSRDDPLPALVELDGLLRRGARSLVSRLPGAAGRLRRRDHAALRKSVRDKGAEGLHIIVLCQGNICRSPFAFLALARLLAAGPWRGRIASAGIFPRQGIASPGNAIKAARESGIDLSAHRSTHLSREMAESADLFVIFDEKNRHWLRSRFPRLPAAAVLLGSFGAPDDDRLEIADPDGGDLDTFRHCYARIEAAIAGLAAAIREAEPC